MAKKTYRAVRQRSVAERREDTWPDRSLSTIIRCLVWKLRIIPVLRLAKRREALERYDAALEDVPDFDIPLEGVEPLSDVIVALVKVSVVRIGIPPSATSTETWEENKTGRRGIVGGRVGGTV